MSKVICLNSSLVFLGFKTHRKICEIRSYVRLNAIKSEVEIIAGAAELLTAKGNTLNSNYCAGISTKVVSGDESSGDINRRKLYLVGINDLNGSILKLGHTAEAVVLTVLLNSTGNSYLHTDLNAKFNGVILDIVSIVAALKALVNKEEVVSGVSCALGVKRNNVTLNDNHISRCAVKILLKRGNLELRNVEAKVLGLGSAGGVLNGCGKNYGECFLCLGNSNGVRAIIVFGNGNSFVARGPFDAVCYVTNGNTTNNCETIADFGSIVFFTIHIPKEVDSRLKTFFNVCVATVIAGVIAVRRVLVVTGTNASGHNAQAKHEGKNEK